MPVVREQLDDTKRRWQQQIRQAQAAQKPYWGDWATNLAFAAGQHWLVWHEASQQLRSIKAFDARFRGRELFTADRITERRQAQLGELSNESDRPELLATDDGETTEQLAETLNALCGYAWDQEWEADAALARARPICLDLGYVAIRCRWNPDEGPVAGMTAIGPDGQPAEPGPNGALADGSLPQFQTVHEGRTEWEVYSPFQSLTPAGIVHERQFPWEALVKPVTIDEVFDVYGVKVQEDADIVSTIGVPAAVQTGSGQRGNNRLRDHCWLYLGYDRPSRRHPQGQSLVFAGPTLDLVDVKQGLPYSLNRKPHTGIVYMHWWRLSDRFQSRSFVEGMKDPQRILNRRKTQNVEIIDRTMPKLITQKGDWPGDTTGAPMELIEMAKGAQAPQLFQGNGPGPWMYQDIASLDEDLAHASTLSDLRLGDNPANVATFSQLALLNDNEHGKRQTINTEHRQVIADLVRLSLADARRYWPEEKTAMIAGEDDRIRQIVFKKSQIPDDVRTKIPGGQPLPRSQGAEVKKIDAIWQAMVQSGLAVGDPVAASNWYKDSLEAGRALDLPKASPSSQEQLAELENMLMRQGEDVTPTYYDVIGTHLPIHRDEEDQARAEGNADLAGRVERHIQAHKQLAMQNAQELAQQQMALSVPPPAAAPPASPPVPPQDLSQG